ncbi:MAG: DUF3108 domain-containing protein [Opitutaceae bacterium]|nr:DUF3108 domain-containing protein [Opitutaceae bacterium]
MIARFLRLSLACLGTAAAAAAGTVPLHDGEQLTYRVSWAIVPGAGEIKISGRQDNSGPTPTMVVTTTTATRRLARMLLPFDAEARSIFDLQTGKLVSLHESSTQKGKQSEHRVTFNYDTRKAIYTPVSKGEPARELDIPEGDPTDLMMGLLQTRTWDLKPGQKRDALVLFDDDFYELTIHMARYEDVSTSLGKFRTVVLEPRMDKTPPKGMFRRGSSVRIWIAQDSHRLPVKFEVEFKIGTGTATLEAYVPPAKSPAPHGTNPRP